MTLVNAETGEIVERLTAMERSALTHAEAAIEQGADQVARSLGQIRDQRLYREEYLTFEAYCRERWGMGRNYVNKQIVAAEVAELLGTNGTQINERQARELADLRDEPEVLRETYQRAHDATGGKVTAAAIREARPPSPGRPPAPPRSRTASHAVVLAEVVTQLSGLTRHVLPTITDLDESVTSEEAIRLRDGLSETRSQLSRVINLLKERST